MPMINHLLKILPQHSIVSDSDLLETYSEDKSTVYKKKPSVVVRPKNIREIKNVLKFARENNIQIICWGQGTSVTGTCLSFHNNSIVLSLERLNRILEIDTKNLIAVVEPGVVVSKLKQEAEKHNLFYPPDPASFESSTVGGNIATGAGGPSAVKYGVTKDYVTGMEVILSSGETITLGGKTVKNSSGYNLKELFVSSEGTLGIITKIFLKLLPKPTYTLTIYITFQNILSLLQSVNLILTNSLLPKTIEYIDDIALFYLKQKFSLPDKNSSSSLIIEIEYDHVNQKDFIVEKIYNILSVIKGFREMFPLESPLKEREIWSARRSIGEVFRENFNKISKADIVVPRGYIYETIKEIKEYADKNKLKASCFGHAGDGNIHVNLLSQNEINKKHVKNIYKTVKKYNGMPSGEHGIGIYKKEFLKDFLSEKEIDLMKKIKKIFDPYCILNKGKIFDI
jgi:glycolate oxidase